MSYTRETFKDLPADELDFVVAYKYKGKTAEELSKLKTEHLDKEIKQIKK